MREGVVKDLERQEWKHMQKNYLDKEIARIRQEDHNKN